MTVGQPERINNLPLIFIHQHPPLASSQSLPVKEKSRRISQMPPASKDSPLARNIGSKFVMIPTGGTDDVKKSENVTNKPLGPTLSLPQQNTKSRKFSQLAPASVDNPNAVKMGSKFTMIPHDK